MNTPYFLELWGTTSECWTYYSETTTPLFTVFAHGMAAVSVWRVIEIIQQFMICNDWGKTNKA